MILKFFNIINKHLIVLDFANLIKILRVNILQIQLLIILDFRKQHVMLKQKSSLMLILKDIGLL